MVRAIAPLLTPRAPRAIITTVPIVADLAAAFPSHHWIYYCVDDLAEWPGLDGTTLRRMEKALLPRVARIVVVSDALGERLARLGFDSNRSKRPWRRPPRPWRSIGDMPTAGSIARSVWPWPTGAGCA